jgi:hypothetical protein
MKQHAGQRQRDGGRKQRREFGQHLLVGGQRGAEIAVQQLHAVVDELLPHRLVQAQLVTEHRQAFGRNAALAHPHLHRIARHQPDGDEGDEHQRDERRDGERQAAQQVAEHGVVVNVLGGPPRASMGRGR